MPHLLQLQRSGFSRAFRLSINAPAPLIFRSRAGGRLDGGRHVRETLGFIPNWDKSLDVLSRFWRDLCQDSNSIRFVQRNCDDLSLLQTFLNFVSGFSF